MDIRWVFNPWIPGAVAHVKSHMTPVDSNGISKTVMLCGKKLGNCEPTCPTVFRNECKRCKAAREKARREGM